MAPSVRTRGAVAAARPPAFLSRLDKKRELYAVDRCFQDGWQHVQELWGTHTRNRVWRLSSVIFKPEAIVGRSIEAGLVFLKEAGFTPVAARPFRFAPGSVREVWRYQINVATQERIAVVNVLLGATPSLYVLLSDEREGLEIPSSLRLAAAKGNVDPARRSTGDLRSSLGSASRFLSHVHTPDEPADVLREFAILFPRSIRTAMCGRAEAGCDRTEEVILHAGRLYDRFPRHDLDFSNSLMRIGQAAVAANPLPDLATTESLGEVTRLCRALQRRGEGDASKLFALTKALGVQVDIWDWIAVAAELVNGDIPGETAILPTVGSELWLKVEG